MAVLLACISGGPAFAAPLGDDADVNILGASVPPPVSSDLAGSPAYQAQQAATATSTPASSVSALSGPTTSVNSDCNSTVMCNPAHCQAYANGRQQAMMLGLTRNTEFYKFSVSAAYAAQCVGKLIEYVNQISAIANKVITAASSPDIATALITLAAVTVLDAVITQLLTQLNNQICAITNQLTSYMDSVINNAICLPSANLKQFNFGATNLGLQGPSCQGLAINPIGLYNASQGVTASSLTSNSGSGISFAGTALDPSTGLGGTTGTAIMGSQVVGLGSYGFANSLDGTGAGNAGGAGGTGTDGTPLFRNDYTYAGGADYTWSGSGTDDTSGGTSNGGAVSNVTCSSGSLGGYAGYAAKTAQLESGGCGNGYNCTSNPSYLGKYQMGVATICTLGYCTCSGSGCYGNKWNSVSYTGKGGVTSAASLQTPSIQDAIFAAETAYLAGQIRALGLTSYIGQTVCGVELTDAGIRAAMHLIGPSGAARAIKSADCGSADGNGTTWLSRASALGCYNF